MAGFHYRMQNILDVTEKLESQAKIAYSEANTALREEQEKLQQLLLRRADYEEKLREQTSGTLHISDIRHTRDAIQAMRSLIRTQLMNVHRAEQNLEKRRAELADVQRRRKTHEKLKEKAFDEFKRDLIHKEDLATDELVSYTHRSSE